MQHGIHLAPGRVPNATLQAFEGCKKWTTVISPAHCKAIGAGVPTEELLVAESVIKKWKSQKRHEAERTQKEKQDQTA